MNNKTPSLFEMVILKRRDVLYRVRILSLFLFAFALPHLPIFKHITPALRSLFLLWSAFSWFYYTLYQKDTKDTELNLIFFLQSLTDTIILLLIIHVSGGPESPFLPLYLLWVVLLSGFQPPVVSRYFAPLAVIFFLFLMESYHWGILTISTTPEMFSPKYLFAKEIIWFIGLAIGITLMRHLVFYHEQIWSETYSQQEFLSLVANIASTNFENHSPTQIYNHLAKTILTRTQYQAVFIVKWDVERNSGNLLGSAGISQVDDPQQPYHLVRALRRENKPYLQQPEGWLAVRLYETTGKNFLGALIFKYVPEPPFSEQEIHHALKLGNIMALLISHNNKYYELNHRAALLQRLSRKIVHLTTGLANQDLLASIARATQDLLNAQRVAIYLFEHEGNLSCAYANGLSSTYIAWLENNHKNLLSWNIPEGEYYTAVSDVLSDRRTSPQLYFLHQEAIRAYALFDLSTQEQRIGILALYWDYPHAFTQHELDIGHLFAQRAAEVIINAATYHHTLNKALTDELTNIPNRRALSEQIEKEISRAQRYQHHFAFLMLDLDGFKQVNDQYGHPIGDSALRQVASKLSQNLRSTDFLARYGGDEFSIILPETSIQEAVKTAQKIRMALEQYLLILPDNQKRNMLSASIGIASYPDDARTAETLMHIADERLYCAKQNGPGKICYNHSQKAIGDNAIINASNENLP